jgi:hypothetical protein
VKEGVALADADIALKLGTADAFDLTATTPAPAAEHLQDLDVSTVTGAQKAMAMVDKALDSINNTRADLGAIQNRFTSVVANLQTSTENLSASRSRIKIPISPRNRRTDPHPDPAAGRYGHAGPGQPGTAERAQPVAALT